MNTDDKIYVAGHRGLVGSAIMRRLRDGNYRNVITRSHSELDLTNQAAVNEFFKKEKPEYVFLAAAKVGGILANNTYRVEFIYQNLMIESNVIHASYEAGVKKLLFLGSSCIYPKLCPQPMKEEYLLTGQLEPTNEPYAISKIAGIEMCDAYNRQYGTKFLCAMPTNLYGPGDNYDLENSHVLPALIRKFHEAKIASQSSVVVWGTGTPRREFLYSDDLADACVFLMNLPDDVFDPILNPQPSALSPNPPPLTNIGCGEDLTILELADVVRDVVGYEGDVTWDRTKPDGTPRKLLDVSRVSALGWKPAIELREGVAKAYDDYLSRFSDQEAQPARAKDRH